MEGVSPATNTDDGLVSAVATTFAEAGGGAAAAGVSLDAMVQTLA